MSENLKDILSNLNPDIDQETLMLYLQGKLSAEKQHEVEQQMMENEFNADALEGLEQMKNKREISSIVEQLQRDLKKKTEKKRRKSYGEGYVDKKPSCRYHQDERKFTCVIWEEENG